MSTGTDLLIEMVLTLPGVMTAWPCSKGRGCGPGRSIRVIAGSGRPDGNGQDLTRCRNDNGNRNHRKHRCTAGPALHQSP